MQLTGRIVAFCCRHAAYVALATILLGAGACYYSVENFALNSDSAKLISQDLPWRQREAQFDKAFPEQGGSILVVIDGATAELAERAATTLYKKLGEKDNGFLSVSLPGGGDFFARNGLLYLSKSEVQSATEQLIAAQPFLGGLAEDPSLRGIASSLSLALDGIMSGQAEAKDLERSLSVFSDVLGQVVEGKPVFLSWRSLIAGKPSTRLETRRFIQVRPQLEFGNLSPGHDATERIRNIAAGLHLVPEAGVTVRLTGQVPLTDEEFGTLAERAIPMTSVMVFSVLLMLWLALRSARIILAIVITLFAGLTTTTAFGLITVGALNPISVAFIALFVGLGVDFGIQFSVRYREERHEVGDLDRALANAGARMGQPLALAAAATAAGFFAVLPTDYIGVAELGLIAGAGMIVAFVLNLTMLPALLKLLRPLGEAKDIGLTFLAPVDHFLEQRRQWIIGIIVFLGSLSFALAPFLDFDFNPLDLKNPRTESVSTLFDLMKDRATSPNAINVLAPSLYQAGKIAKKLSALPEVDQAITLLSFVPEDQPEKLALIADASSLLDATINPFDVKPAPTDAETIDALNMVAAKLHEFANTKAGATTSAKRLGDIFAQVAAGSPELRARVANALVPGLQTMLAQVSSALQAGPVSLSTLPPDLVHDWVSTSGAARVQVVPSGDPNNNDNLRSFAAAVLTVAPNASGGAIGIQGAGRTIVQAFIQAGILSFLSITVILIIVLRRARDVILTLVPLFLTGLLSLGTCVAIGLELNFANIIALPLLFGIGVAFNIYFVVAWRKGMRHLLQSSLARAVLFSALTTASAFGTLWLSSHPGMASMGQLLTIALAWTLVTALLFLPALLDAWPEGKRDRATRA